MFISYFLVSDHYVCCSEGNTANKVSAFLPVGGATKGDSSMPFFFSFFFLEAARFALDWLHRTNTTGRAKLAADLQAWR